MPYKTAGILSLAVVATMFILPAVAVGILLPSLSDPIPWYDRIILEVSAFFLTWRFVLVMPTIGLFFTVATLTELLTGPKEEP